MMKVKWLMPVVTGQRVMLHQDLEAPGFYELKAGTTGVVTFVNDSRGVCSVRVDDWFDGCENLDRELFFNLKGAFMPEEEWFVLQDVAWPLPSKERTNGS